MAPFMTIQRDECRLTIARQIAIAEGRVWDRLPPKITAHYITLAGNILATVERMALRVNWKAQ